MFCAPPAGLSLQQHPGAAWVIFKNSSISDFVAGGELLSLSHSSVVASRWKSFPFVEEVSSNKVTCSVCLYVSTYTLINAVVTMG